ncbi:MAG: DNA mismatch repair protein [Bacteroidia bacterium]|nr:DNA mismatch repair protein [Bacteroidia bacterium]
MSFLTDKQTLTDLNILGKYVNNSIFSIFNEVQTIGGEKLLDKLFHEPLSEPRKINKRSQLFRFFQDGKYQFPVDNEDFTIAEQYLNHTDYPNSFTAWFNTVRIRLLLHIGLDKEYRVMEQGLEATIRVLKDMAGFIKEVESSTKENLYTENCDILSKILNDKQLYWIYDYTAEKRISLFKFAKYDHAIRYSLKNEMNRLLNIIYEIDVFTAVAQVAEKKGFNYAEADEKDKNYLLFEGLFHPGIKDAIDNNIHFYKDRNVVFLTGANMAGKSTLMKAIGAANYLAHMGFPVPAKKMQFSVKDGIFTSINVPDNLNMGYSHFYAEVLRVKSVAQEVASNKHLLIIFDELFKGTNVKDAYEATVAITDAFSKKINSTFIISTHIMEAGEALKDKENNIQFLFLPTEMDGVTPIYTYKLKEGITDDRHGMIIINNEKILEIINGEY